VFVSVFGGLGQFWWAVAALVGKHSCYGLMKEHGPGLLKHSRRGAKILVVIEPLDPNHGV
jgi:hypothetical protein